MSSSALILLMTKIVTIITKQLATNLRTSVQYAGRTRGKKIKEQEEETSWQNRISSGRHAGPPSGHREWLRVGTGAVRPHPVVPRPMLSAPVLGSRTWGSC